jgi:RHS repeat-associated protein
MQAWSYTGEAGALPKTRVWGSKPENVHCFSATAPLGIELRWGCEESSEKTAVGSGVTFKYDPFGRRIEKVSPTTTSIFAYDGDNLVETVGSTGGVVARYTQQQNIDEPLAMQRGTTTSYYEQDGLGSVTSLTNAAGALAQTYTYDSFGNQTASSGSLTNFFRYTGREFDTETGLYYFRARYFDPTTGRFLSEDPIGFDGDGTDFYAYVENDPTTSIDPFGLQHQPGGPYHPPPGKQIRCLNTDPCPVLLDKLEEWAHTLASHYLWDWTHSTNRHQQPAPNGAPSDVDQLWNGFERCLSIYLKKCHGDCEKNPQPAPNPSPNPAPGPVPIPFMPLPSPGMPPVLPEPPIIFPEPIPVPIPL